MGAAVTSLLLACGAKAACEAMGDIGTIGAAAGDCATGSTDWTDAGLGRPLPADAGEGAASITLSAFQNRF